MACNIGQDDNFEMDTHLFQYYQQLWDAFNEGVCITDATGTIILLNKQYSIIAGISKEEMINRNVDVLVKSGLLDVVLNPEVIRTKQRITKVQHVSNGRHLVIDGNPVFNEKGDVVMCVSLIRDCTTVTQLREQLNVQKELLEALQHLSIGVKGVDYPSTKQIVCNSAVMRRLERDIVVIAETDATVLLIGDTGVGKEVTARRIHALSPRKDKAFIKIDCGSIPEHLIETELFGYAAGTFSGANKNGKIGLFEAAEGGTLFLDEIGELPLHLQTRLLRFLQDKEIMRVGSTVSKTVNVRIIAATNRDLGQAVERGEFRSDLYYRINVAMLEIPTLRERKSDILHLAHRVLDGFNAKYHKKTMLSEEAEKALVDYHWPGNVRELENILQRAVITAKGTIIHCEDLNIIREKTCLRDNKLKLSIDIENKSFDEIITHLERAVIGAALEKYESITEVAKRFQVARSTVFRKLKRFENNEKTDLKRGHAIAKNKEIPRKKRKRTVT